MKERDDDMLSCLDRCQVVLSPYTHGPLCFTVLPTFGFNVFALLLLLFGLQQSLNKLSYHWGTFDENGLKWFSL